MKGCVLTALIVLGCVSQLWASDWPLYKGNIYFTGNNDEIVVPNGNLKWLYQAGDRIYNPVVSDGMIYFIDQSAHLYCLNEQSGRFRWKISIRDISAQFKRLSRAAGKVKYPLIKGNYLYLTDPVAIYCLNKNSGKVLWARTGASFQNGAAGTSARVSGIYSDPVITDSDILYGTRNSFYSRKLLNGHENWSNDTIESYSGFPTFYDDYVLVQSMNYTDNSYKIVKLKGADGKELWKRQLPKPFKIFPPVVYEGRIYIPVSQKLFCLNLDNGNVLWSKDYGGIISAGPSFTDRSILFTVDNSKIIVVNPADGKVLDRINVGDKSSPRYVMVRNQIYIAYNGDGAVNRAYGHVRAVNFNSGDSLWTFKTPFPGAISQPLASKGILFLPAGNYLYAIGASSYPRTVEGGSTVDNETVGDEPDSDAGEGVSGDDGGGDDNGNTEGGVRLREYRIRVTDGSGHDIPAYATIEQHDADGNRLYAEQVPVRDGKISIPQGEGVHVAVGSDGYVPDGFSPGRNEEGRQVSLDKINRGESFVVNDVTFELNSAYLTKQSLPVLEKLLQIMKHNPQMKLEISGHTDNSGQASYNMHLSERRADAVAEYMIKNGISPERISSRGYGETRPAASNDTEEGREKNRRTEFIFK